MAYILPSEQEAMKAASWRAYVPFLTSRQTFPNKQKIEIWKLNQIMNSSDFYLKSGAFGMLFSMGVAFAILFGFLSITGGPINQNGAIIDSINFITALLVSNCGLLLIKSIIGRCFCDRLWFIGSRYQEGTNEKADILFKNEIPRISKKLKQGGMSYTEILMLSDSMNIMVYKKNSGIEKPTIPSKEMALIEKAIVILINHKLEIIDYDRNHNSIREALNSVGLSPVS